MLAAVTWLFEAENLISFRMSSIFGKIITEFTDSDPFIVTVPVVPTVSPDNGDDTFIVEPEVPEE
jgi:hypothetical protein